MLSRTATAESLTCAADESQLMGVNDDGTTSLIDDAGNTRDDVKMPEDEEMAAKIKEAHEAGDKEVFVTVLSALKTNQIVAFSTKDYTD